MELQEKTQNEYREDPWSPSDAQNKFENQESAVNQKEFTSPNFCLADLNWRFIYHSKEKGLSKRCRHDIYDILKTRQNDG